ncbi:MAG: M1 family peptidase, partial [Fluviicola sp.]|nr:M1 family peptidase [Fluviicola sp.]
MKHLLIGGSLVVSSILFGQSKFAQLDMELPTPNEFRTAAGAPGNHYYQQKADYKMSITLDDKKQIISGEEVITYTNNSPDVLEYLWLQLDQNIYKKDAENRFIEVEKMEDFKSIKDVERKLMVFDGGYNIVSVASLSGEKMKFA